MPFGGDFHGEVSPNDVTDRSLIGAGHREPDAAPEEGCGEVSLLVAGHDDERELGAPDPATMHRISLVGVPHAHRDFCRAISGQLCNLVLAAFKYFEQVARQVEVALIDFVDEQGTRPAIWDKGRPKRAELQEWRDVIGSVPGIRLVDLLFVDA